MNNLQMDSNVPNFISDMNRRAGDVLRRVNRFIEGPMTRKKLLLIVLTVVFLTLYLGPLVHRFHLKFGSGLSLSEHQKECQNMFQAPFNKAILEYDAYMRVENKAVQHTTSHNYVPYIGNGYLGLTLEHDSILYIKHGRILSLPVNFHPLYIIQDKEVIESTVVDYKNGIVHRFQCGYSGSQASYQYYAHRALPSLLVQEIHIQSHSDAEMVQFESPKVTEWLDAETKTVTLKRQIDDKEYKMTTGKIQLPDSDKIIVAAIVYAQMPATVALEAKNTLDITLLTIIHYSSPISASQYGSYKDSVESAALADMDKAVSMTKDRPAAIKTKETHSKIWQSLWYTGFYISDSKAEGIINGDRINATIYAVLCQARTYEHEQSIEPAKKMEIMRTLSYSEGCFEGYSTLDAFNLWKPLNTAQNLIEVASIWYLTLEKLGCHNLLKAGASGVNQAMILSFGSLRFSNQHLEYNIQPSKLHRDFLFRRVNYGNMTHVNISIIVQEDNKAALFVALDRSDKNYYACDAGCLDSPVQLGPYRKYFPVKLTEPLTAILYITADKKHMEDLRHAIHVKEVAEAPAHENHIIALHKHGHSLGGLNPLFWVSVIAIIVFFHLFLCRLIMNEFCDSGVSYRRLNNRP